MVLLGANVATEGQLQVLLHNVGEETVDVEDGLLTATVAKSKFGR